MKLELLLKSNMLAYVALQLLDYHLVLSGLLYFRVVKALVLAPGGGDAKLSPQLGREVQFGLVLGWLSTSALLFFALTAGLDQAVG